MLIQLKLHQRIQQLDNRLARYPLLIRLGILCVIVGAIYGLWVVLLQHPLRQQVLTQDAALAKITTEVVSFQQQAREIEQHLKRDPSLAANKALTDKHAQVALLNQDKQVVFASIATTQEVLHLFGEALKKFPQIELQRLDSVAAVPLVEPHEELTAMSEYDALEKNGVELSIISDFFSTLGYLQELEQGGLRVFWDSLDYQVVDYPKARIVVRVNFISHRQQQAT